MVGSQIPVVIERVGANFNLADGRTVYWIITKTEVQHYVLLPEGSVKPKEGELIILEEVSRYSGSDLCSGNEESILWQRSY